MVKKITAALFFVLAGTSALAAQTDSSMPMVSGVVLMVPHQEGSWSFGLQANYLEPDTDYKYFHTALDTLNFFPVIGESNRIYTVGSDYNWGWGADISYHFPGNGRDVNLAFTQLNTSYSDSVNEPKKEVPLDMPFFFVEGSHSGKHSAEVETNYNAADLTFGQLITVGQRLSLHPFAGLRYASIDYKAKAQADDSYNAIAPNIPGLYFDLRVKDEPTWESDFQGLGPRFGSDAGFNLGRGFSLRSTLGLSLLAGDIEVRGKQYHNEALLIGSDRGLPFSLNETTNTDNKIDTNTRVVPEADAKLSAMYTTYVDNGYTLSFEGGYQVTNYFSAVENSVMSTQDTSTQYTNYFIQGPYARVQLDVA